MSNKMKYISFLNWYSKVSELLEKCIIQHMYSYFHTHIHKNIHITRKQISQTTKQGKVKRHLINQMNLDDFASFLVI